MMLQQIGMTFPKKFCLPSLHLYHHHD